MSQVRVLIVDDVPYVRRDLCTLLTVNEETQVVGEAGDGHEAIRQAEMLHPDVVLMDLEMPVMDGYTAAREIKAICPSSRVIALSIHGDDDSRSRASRAGVDAFVEKGAPLATLLCVIQQFARGA
jgi:DNA-binding NarL/FixJ family response regulator